MLCIGCRWCDFWWERLRCGVDRFKWWCAIFLNRSYWYWIEVIVDQLWLTLTNFHGALNMKWRLLLDNSSGFIIIKRNVLFLAHGQTLVVAQGLSAKLPGRCQCTNWPVGLSQLPSSQAHLLHPMASRWKTRYSHLCWSISAFWKLAPTLFPVCLLHRSVEVPGVAQFTPNNKISVWFEQNIKLLLWY